MHLFHSESGCRHKMPLRPPGRSSLLLSLSAAAHRAVSGRVSGPLLDRIDLHVEVPAVSLAELRSSAGESTQEVARRVAAARTVQLDRFGAHTPSPTNSTMGPEQLRRFCAVDAAGRGLLDTAFERLGLSARALDRVLKVARTIADLAGSDAVRASHLAEAIQYRSLDRR